MSYLYDRNTIAGQSRSRLLMTGIGGIGHSRIGKLCDKILAPDFLTLPAPQPHIAAAQFYLLEHAMGAMMTRKRPFDQLTGPERDLCEEYHDTNQRALRRAFYYTLLICCRETRHCMNKKDIGPALAQITGWPEGVVVRLLQEFPDNPVVSEVTGVLTSIAPDRSLGDLTRLLTAAFWLGSYHSMYGGPKWGTVANCLNEFVHGNMTPIMFLDTVWTLAHNTAPIFNKGMLYKQQDAQALIAVLDIQRAGMIPQMCMSNGYNTGLQNKLTPNLKTKAAMLHWLEGDFAPGGFVNMQKVQALGAVAGKKNHAPTPKLPAWLQSFKSQQAAAGPNMVGIPGLSFKKANPRAN